MQFLPVFLDLRGREVVVVGGGEVAARKVALLIEAGARVRVVSPRLTEVLAARLARAEIGWREGQFQDSDLDTAAFVIAATDDPALNLRVAAAGAARRLFVNAVDDAAASSCLMPAIVDRSPLMVAVGSGGNSPTLVRRVREQVEALLPAGLGALADSAGRWRERVRAALPDPAARRRFWDRWFGAAAAASATPSALSPESLDAALAAALAAGAAASATHAGAAAGSTAQAGVAAGGRGEVWLIGAGPGDPDLLTLRAQQLLAECDVVLYDRLVDEAVLGRVRRDAERVYVGKETGQHRETQERIHRLLLDYAGRGLRVARLKGGDPLVFARGGEELSLLVSAGIPVTVVPGVTAASGAAASAQLSLTQRGLAQAVCLVTAMGEQSGSLDWRSLAAPLQTVVFYMGVGQLERIVQQLREHGAPATRGAVIVERASLPGERVLRATLADVAARAAGAGVQAPALLIVGDVASGGGAQTKATERGG